MRVCARACVRGCVCGCVCVCVHVGGRYTGHAGVHHALERLPVAAVQMRQLRVSAPFMASIRSVMANMSTLLVIEAESFRIFLRLVPVIDYLRHDVDRARSASAEPVCEDVARVVCLCCNTIYDGATRYAITNMLHHSSGRYPRRRGRQASARTPGSLPSCPSLRRRR